MTRLLALFDQHLAGVLVLERLAVAHIPVENFLNELHAAIRPSVRPTTWINYRNYLDFYVIPVIGQTRLRDLTPVRLNLLYGHLLDRADRFYALWMLAATTGLRQTSWPACSERTTTSTTQG